VSLQAAFFRANESRYDFIQGNLENRIQRQPTPAVVAPLTASHTGYRSARLRYQLVPDALKANCRPPPWVASNPLYFTKPRALKQGFHDTGTRSAEGRTSFSLQ
jgi:hypothetical protein